MDNNILTIEEFNKIEPDNIFGLGEFPNSPEGLYMTDSRFGDSITWLAKKGYANDWCIYCHWSENPIDYIASNGDKVINEDHIRKCVPCTDEVFKRYRY